MNSDASMSGARLHHLDALRGVAAFVVVIHHALLALPADDPLPALVHRLLLLRVVELGRPAVILFFVLSGFVLAICLERGRTSFSAFLARRLVRLLPPYWAAIGAAFLLYSALPHDQLRRFSPWLSSQWSGGISAQDLADHLLMLAGPAQFPLDHVAWSLVHELRLSLLVPVFVLIAARSSTACLGIAAVIAALASLVVALMAASFPAGLYGLPFDAPGLAPSFVLTLRYLLPFACGIVLAKHRVAITPWLSRPWIAPAAGIVSMALLSLPSEVAMMAGATLLLAAAVVSPACARALDAAPLSWLGRTSYSLYLVHIPVMLGCAALLGGTLQPRIVLLCSIVIALGAAQLLFVAVERPSTLWSRAAARALGQTRMPLLRPGRQGFKAS